MTTDEGTRTAADRRTGPGTAQGTGSGRTSTGAGTGAGTGSGHTSTGTGIGGGSASATVAATIEPLVEAVLGGPAPVRFEFWDGSGTGPAEGPGPVRVNSADAVRRMLWSPGELGLARAYVAGDVDLDGDLFGIIDALLGRAAPRARISPAAAAAALRAGRRLGAFGTPPPPPAEEARPHGRVHSKFRDAQAVSHHYDVGNAFYQLVLGPSMTYSCARFTSPDSTLEEAQAAKYELICRKLGLGGDDDAAAAGGGGGTDIPRLLDIGCGWGSMAMHAAARHGAEVVGVTISREQAELARERVAAAGLADRVQIRLQDYRDLAGAGETFDAVSSIGMFEHVGKRRIGEYFDTVRALLRPRGRLLNHAISSVGGSAMGPNSFIGRYVFPDGELIDVGDVVLAMEKAGFEVRDVESLREHYARTLRSWVANLESHWDEAVRLVGPGRARVWRLYMAASAVRFEQNGIAIHQVLGVVPDALGHSGMPATRRSWN